MGRMQKALRPRKVFSLNLEKDKGKGFPSACEIKSLSLLVPSGDSAEMIKFMCHSIICSLKASSLTVQLHWIDVTEKCGDSAVGAAATGGALDLVDLIDYICLAMFAFQSIDESHILHGGGK